MIRVEWRERKVIILPPLEGTTINDKIFPSDWPYSYSYVEEGKKYLGFAPNGDSLTIPEGYTVARIKNSIYVVGMTSPDREVFQWNEEAGWFVSQQGNDFDNPLYEDISNYIMTSTKDSIGTIAKDAFEHGNPFKTIGESYDAYKEDGGTYGVLGYVGSGLKSSFVTTYEDMKYGGHRRMNATIRIWQFSSATAKGYSLSLTGKNIVTKGGTFYRAMSNAEYAALESSGGLSHMAGKELFVSNSAKYARDMMLRHPNKYDILVQFNMKPGAMNYFNQVGVMHRTPAGASGWAGRGNLLWKSEGKAMNLGIQSNTHMFNPWINSFKKIK